MNGIFENDSLHKGGSGRNTKFVFAFLEVSLI